MTANLRSRFSCLLLMLFLAGAAVTLKAQLRPEDVQIGPEKDHRTIYSLTDHEDHAALAIDRSLAALASDTATAKRLPSSLHFTAWHGEDTYQPGAKSFLPIGRKMELLRPLLARLFQVENGEKEYNFTIAGYDEMYERLPGLAAQSKDWDRRLGYSPLGVGHSFIADLLNDGNAFPELAKTVEEFRYQAKVVGVEKVLVVPVSELTAEEKASIPEPVKNTDKFPVSAMIYFLLTKEN